MLPKAKPRTGTGGGLELAMDETLERAFEVWSWSLPVNRIPGENELKIEPEFVRVRAYYKYEHRGRTDGHWAADWFEAEDEFKRLFASYLRTRRQKAIAVTAEVHERDEARPMHGSGTEFAPDVDEATADRDHASVNPNLKNRRDDRPGAETPLGDVRLVPDHRGVAWLPTPIPRDRLTDDEMTRLFGAYRMVAVHCESDLVYLAGDSESDIAASLEERDLPPDDYAVEPVELTEPRS